MSATIVEMLFAIALHQGRYTDPRSLARHRCQMYSQFGEDGVIAEIFSRIGERDRFFVEFGTQNGIHNNTRFLLEQGWRGLWVDAAFGDAAALFADYIESGALRLEETVVTIENVNALLDKHDVPESFDFLSLDIDYNTSHVWRALRRRSRVVCIEYNAAVPASAAVEVPYDPAAVWDSTTWFGAGLKVLEQIGTEKRMNLVGCELAGINAFFVEATPETAQRFQKPFTAEHHYEPPRGGAVGYFGHDIARVARRWVRAPEAEG